ncbi:MFS general substrate transporter [Vararia minispora EC-137]|uniref:MFS general substrate transporter n=1 Tax=Vararia minispora EC-137 TaxID=1314806 RepID=A0ACB8R0V4_9AGAM|nr:MFS general substrate transporter [Vararia minispora EC-137]
MPMAIGTFLASMDGTIVLSSYASIGNELKELQSSSWISTGYMLTLAAFQPLYGKMSDIFGRKPCLQFAYVVFALGSIFCGLAGTMSQLILARAFAGIGGGGMQTIVSIVMSDIIPLRQRGTWQGIINLVWATGMAVGAPLGGLLADSIGWRWAFLLQAPLAMAALTAVSVSLRLPKPETTNFRDRLKRIDFGGASILVVSLVALLLGLDRGGNVSWGDPVTIASLAIFAIAFPSFLVVEFKLAKEPFAPKRIVLNPALLASYLCNLFCVSAGNCTIFYVSLYVQVVLKRTAAQAGLTLMPSIVGGVLGSLLGGFIIQVTGRYFFITVISYAWCLCGLILMTLSMGPLHTYLGLEIGLFIMANGNGAGITTTLISLIAQAGPADQAIATAASYLFRSIGSVLGLSVGSTVFQELLRHYLTQRLQSGNADEIVRRVREALSYIDELDPASRAIVRSSYGMALQTTFYFALACATCSFISSFFVKEKPIIHKEP